MPVFEYRCTQCGREMEDFWPTYDAAVAAEPIPCQYCGGPAERIISTVAIRMAPSLQGPADSGDDDDGPIWTTG